MTGVGRLLAHGRPQREADLGVRLRPDVDRLLVQLRRRRFVVDRDQNSLQIREPVPEMKGG